METISLIFIELQKMLEGSLILAVTASFIWGILSVVLSPCHISSIPLVVGYVNRDGKQSSKKALLTSVYFSTGVFISLIIIGVITSLMGKMIGDIGQIGMIVVGTIFILTGIWLMDLLKTDSCNINLFRGKNGAGGILMGFIFGAALGPCTFGFMFPVMAVAFKAADKNILISIFVITAYAIGHSLVIIFAGTGVNKLQMFLNWDAKSKGTLIIKRVSGVIIIATGIYLIAGKII